MSLFGSAFGSPFGAGTTWAPDTELPIGELSYSQTALDRLWKQLEGLPNWSALMELMGQMLQESELVLDQIRGGNSVRTATGATLTEIGYGFGTPRGPWVDDDDLYRLAIYADAASLYASGTIPELIDLLQRMAPTSQVIVRRMGIVKHIRATVTDLDADVYQAMRSLLIDVPAAGDNLQLETYDTAVVGGWQSVHGGATPLGSWSSTAGGAVVRPLWSHAQPMGS